MIRPTAISLAVLALAVAAAPAAPPAPAATSLARPHIANMLFPAARRLLLRAGWVPIRVAADPRRNPDLGLRGREIAAAGWREAADCSDTGLAFCLFRYRDRRGRVLEVTTAGETFREARVYSATIFDCRARPRPDACR